MTKHFICMGECEGVSNEPGTCQAKECSMYKEPLVPCECDEPEHIDEL